MLQQLLCFTVHLSQRLSNASTDVDSRFKLNVIRVECLVSLLLLEGHQLLERVESLHFFSLQVVELRSNVVTHEVQVLRNVSILQASCKALKSQ